MGNRYDPVKKLIELQEDVNDEVTILGRLHARLRDWKPTDKRGWTHYDYANFQGTSKQDILVAIDRAEDRIRDLRRRLEEAADAIERGDNEEDAEMRSWLVY